MLNFLKKFVRDESGMEMIEWTIVAIVFALAASASWELVKDAVDGALQNIGSEINETSG